MRVSGLFLCIVLIAFGLGYAGGVITNETNYSALGLHIVFSEPVVITGFGNALSIINPKTTQSTEFVITGGKVDPWNSIWLNWEPISAKIVSYEWLRTSHYQKLPSDATSPEESYSLSFNNGQTTFKVVRNLNLHVLPFTVCYRVIPANQSTHYTFIWDRDKYVDENGDGDPINDRDAEGATIELFYTENYNPTVTLTILNSNGTPIGNWENMIRNDFMINQDIKLDGVALLKHYGINPDEVRCSWSQLHMQRMSFEYMSVYDANLMNADNLKAHFKSANVGRYVFKLHIEQNNGSSHKDITLAAWITEHPTTCKTLDIGMADVWNTDYDPAQDKMVKNEWDFTDQDAIDKLDCLAQQGFNHIRLRADIAINQVFPKPELTLKAPNLIGNEDLKKLCKHISKPDFSISSFASLTGNKNAFNWMDFNKLNLQYYQEFFRQFHSMLINRVKTLASLNAQTILIDNSYIDRLDDIKKVSPAAERLVIAEWKSIFKDLRKVFSDRLGITVPWCDERYLFRDAVDYVEFGLGDSDGYEKLLATAAARSPEAYKAAFRKYLQEFVLPVGKDLGLPIAFSFMPQSYEGVLSKFAGGNEHEDYTCDTWKPEYASGNFSEQILEGKTMPLFKPSFEEQVYMLETFIPVLVNTPQISQIILFGEYWKMLDYRHFAPENVLDYSQINTTDLYGKPAILVAKLWASILDPNVKNLYRKIAPFYRRHG